MSPHTRQIDSRSNDNHFSFHPDIQELFLVSRKGISEPEKVNPRTRNYKASRWITSALCLLAFLFYAFQLADYSSKQAVVNQELVNCEGRDCYGTPD